MSNASSLKREPEFGGGAEEEGEDDDEVGEKEGRDCCLSEFPPPPREEEKEGRECGLSTGSLGSLEVKSHADRLSSKGMKDGCCSIFSAKEEKLEERGRYE